MNPKWQRWAKASFAKYFGDLLDTITVPFCLQNQDKQAPATDGTFVELRVQGPESRGETKSIMLLKFSIEFLINVSLNDSKNLYKPEVISGQVQSWCYNCIPMLQLGDPADVGTQLGCFRLRDDITPVRATELGTKDPNIKVSQIVIEAHYEIRLQS